jgi:hypothetical protein
MGSAETDGVEEVCAACGTAAVDDVKLKICTACKLVKYCSVECQKNHRPQHKKACKKRLAEIREDKLFKQPDESYLGECPICCLPLPLDNNKRMMNSCCCKWICRGCAHADDLRMEEQGLEHTCPYCREIVPETNEEADQNVMKRVKANDPAALRLKGVKCYIEGDFEGAFEYYTKAAVLGDIEAHFSLSLMYEKGLGVETDLKKEIHHAEEAAIGGHPKARHNLAQIEGSSGRHERAAKHLIIAAKLGDDEALDKVKQGYAQGFVSKEDNEAALRGHQAAVDATKSSQRDKAYAFYNV